MEKYEVVYPTINGVRKTVVESNSFVEALREAYVETLEQICAPYMTKTFIRQVVRENLAVHPLRLNEEHPKGFISVTKGTETNYYLITDETINNLYEECLRCRSRLSVASVLNRRA